MDVHGGVDAENRNIIMWSKHKGMNQQWNIIYADEWKKEPIKGELNTEFGLYVERPFYIVSQLPRNRYLSINGREMVIRTSDDKDTQVWYFHQ